VSRFVPSKLRDLEGVPAGRAKKKLSPIYWPTTSFRRLRRFLGRQTVEELDLEALELAVRQHVLQLAGAAVEQRLNADTSDERGSRTCCGCGQSARLPGADQTGAECLRSPTMERAYYHCAFCGHGYCPRDQRHPSPGGPAPRTRVVASTISRPTDIACAIRSSCARLVYFPRGLWSRVQGSHRHAAQTRRNALDRSRLQRPSSLSAVPKLSGRFQDFWERKTELRARMTHHFLGAHPPHPST